MPVNILFVALLFFTHFIFVYSLLCYACLFTYGEDYTESRDAMCANKSFLLLNLDDTARKCASWEDACVNCVQCKRGVDVCRLLARKFFNTFTTIRTTGGRTCSAILDNTYHPVVTSLSVMHNSIASVQRGCSDDCSKKCKHTGYGTNQVECDDCCTKDLCNGNFSLSYYEEVMKRQFGSWVTPLSGEKKWNKKKKYTFPY